MTDRRTFVSTVSAAGISLARPTWLGAEETALRVDANPTVFFANPDGKSSLVRFEVTGIDAPAGRLRVFDRGRSLLGTAGVLRVGERLYGELWMQLEGATAVVSELEAPGLRGPFRTTHRIEPARRWTVYLLTVADAESVAGVLDGLRPTNRAVQTLIYRQSQVTTNPMPTSCRLSSSEHVSFLRLTERALQIERQQAIPMGTAAYVPPGIHLPKTGAMALAGAGIRVLAREQNEGEPYVWWEVPGESPVLIVSVPEGSTPKALGFDLTQNEMTVRVEDWLVSAALRFDPEEVLGTAIVLNSETNQLLPATLAAISAWNSRYAYPQIVVGGDITLLQEIESRQLDRTVTAPVSIHQPQMPSGAGLAAIARRRVRDGVQRTRDLGRVIGSVVEIRASDFETVAAHIASAVAGTFVFNPSPYAHSDLVSMSDGSERLATNVPGLGYAFFPDEALTGDASAWETVSRTHSAEGEKFRATIDRSSGAISSLVQISDGREWVRPGSDGLNSIPGASLLGLTAMRLSGVATRLVVSRRAPTVGAFTTSVTLYDELPWLSLKNETESRRLQAVGYRFELALREPQVSWEIPAGHDEAPVPVPLLEHMRWIRLEDADGALLFRGLDAPLASVDAEGTLTSHAPSGISQYRVAPLDRYSSPDQPWVFGWDTEPMEVVRAEPNGTDVLPRFGSMLTVEQVGVTVLGVAPAADGYGIIVYLQETLNVARAVSVGAGVLRFRNAETVDYVERYKEQIPLRADGTINVFLPANAVVAVRLSGLELS